MDDIFGHYQSDNRMNRFMHPEDAYGHLISRILVHDTWEPYVAQAISRALDNEKDFNYRKPVAQLGGYIGDYMHTELSCRAGRWIKGYEVVVNWFYHELFRKRKESLNALSKDNKVNRWYATNRNDESVGDCFGVAQVIMLSQGQMQPMWDLAELVRFNSDTWYKEGTDEERRAHATKLLENARSWRPVTVEMPRQAQPPQRVSAVAGTGLGGGHRSEAPGAVADAAPSTGARCSGGHRSEAPGTAAGVAQQPADSDEESLEEQVAPQVAIPPPVEWGGPRTFDITRSEITDLVPRLHEKPPPKVKKNRWLPTPDTVLPCETFDELAADTMTKAGLYTWTLGEANTSGDPWKYVGPAGEVVKGEQLNMGEVRMYYANGFRLLSKGSADRPLAWFVFNSNKC